VKQVFRLSVAIIALTLICCASSLAQTTPPTPDPFVAQLTSSTQNSFAGDISGDGRFVVIESTADLDTGTTGKNADGNREIFLIDYGQRRIFQITNTKNALKNASGSTTDRNNIQVEVVNNKPVISHDGHWIAFSSNATVSGTNLNPGNFDGNANSAALQADGNTEIFLYQVPAFTPVDLSSGIAPNQDLSGGTFKRVTSTPASRAPQPGSDTNSPVVADDNRDVTINDDGSLIAFVSTRDIVPGHNAESVPNPEVFVFRNVGTGGSFTQVTETAGMFLFNENPQLSGSPLPATVRVAFISNANITGNNSDNNSEVYVGTFNGTMVSGLNQVTHTTATTTSPIVNIFSPGRRLSRDGNLLTLESAANLSTDNAVQSTFAVFVYDISATRFTQVVPRATAGTEVFLRFPTFTGDSNTILFTSALNLDASGAIVTSGGLNPNNRVQIFATPAPGPGTPVHLTRLTNSPAPSGAATRPLLQAYASDTTERTAFSVPSLEFGGGNSDSSVETFYLLSLTGTTATGTVSYFTGASDRPIVSPSPQPTPPAVAGLAPGMLGIIRSSVALAPSAVQVPAVDASDRRSPPLPIELNGVSVSVNGAAAGLYFVSPSQINFVVPVGLAANSGTTDTYPVVINNNGTIIRSTLRLLPTQPDIFSTTGGAGGRAMIFNVTDQMNLSGMGTPEPATGFPVTSHNAAGQTVATVLGIMLTGVRNVQASQVTVRFGSTSLSGDAIKAVGPTKTPGFDEIDVQLPSTLAHSCNVPVIVSVTINGQTFTSRPADSAPVISIGPCP
jgi:uncharacterized protein (TIGR03437 family)